MYKRYFPKKIRSMNYSGKELILNTENLRAKVREAERQEGLKSIELTSESSEYSRLVDLY